MVFDVAIGPAGVIRADIRADIRVGIRRRYSVSLFATEIRNRGPWSSSQFEIDIRGRDRISVFATATDAQTRQR